MSNINLILKDIHGETMEESTIVLTNDDTLLVSYPKEMTIEIAGKFYEIIKQSLENNAEFLMLPEGIKLKVLSKDTQK